MASNNSVALLLLLPYVLVASAVFLIAAGGNSSLFEITGVGRKSSNSEADVTPSSLVLPASSGRRKLMEHHRPGSRPPQCARKCGRCTPCWPLYVAVPPPAALPATDAAEYYPEAWRCTCDGRLYVP